MEIKKELLDKANNRINEASYIGILSHQSPDGDSLGSSIAIEAYFRSINKKCVLLIPDEVPDNLKWIISNSEYFIYEGNESGFKGLVESMDLIVALDQNSYSRCSLLGSEIQKLELPSIMIDHHLNPSEDYDIQFSFPEICSTCQLVYHVLSYWVDVTDLDMNFAKGVYTGILTDTGGFRFDSLNSETHLIAATLIGMGLKQSEIHELLFDNTSLNKIKAQAKAFNENLNISNDGKVATLYWSNGNEKSIPLKKGDTEGWVNMALGIEGVQVAAIFKNKNKDQVKISFRSKRNIAINELASEYFNGGGHKNAAGGRFDGTIHEAIEMFVSKVDKVFK
jgi:bifunctional oligoribonuclease and PAP phosphatase NrnA